VALERQEDQPMSVLIAFVVTLGLVILIHELGHFSVCKWTGIYVKTFSIGFGPKIFRRRFGETEYALSIVPFGGYVKMAGEGVMEEIQDAGTKEQYHYPIGTEEGNQLAADRDGDIPSERHFNRRPAWQRLSVVVAGPLANLILAFVIFTSYILTSGLMIIPDTTIGGVEPESPAAVAGMLVQDRVIAVDGQAVEIWSDIALNLIAAMDVQGAESPIAVTIERGGVQSDLMITPRSTEHGWLLGIEPSDTRVGLVQQGGAADKIGLQRGDRIVHLNGHEISAFSQIIEQVSENPGNEIRIVWTRDGQTMEAMVVPETVEVAPDSMAGRLNFERYFESRSVSLGEGIERGWQATWNTVTGIVGSLPLIFQSGMDAVGGPIRVGQVAGEMLRWSFGHLMQFVAFFSVNLFLLNLLPIPVLDGGHVVFILFEVISGRPVPQKFQAIATQVGLIVLMLFMITVIVKDVLRVLPGSAS
jgi:regulator of sigma E protease